MQEHVYQYLSTIIIRLWWWIITSNCKVYVSSREYNIAILNYLM